MIPNELFLLEQDYMKAIIGQKIGMTRIFDDKGNAVPVTLILVPENVVTQLKTEEKDGYSAVQIALPEDKKLAKPQIGHLAKAQVTSRTLREFEPEETYTVGQKLNVSQFEVGDLVAVTAMSKGKGFAGTVKRHHFHTGPKTHGSDNYRRPGSIGPTYPQRVIKGRRMGGHLGADINTIKNLKIVNIDPLQNILMVNGAVPGIRKNTIFIWK